MNLWKNLQQEMQYIKKLANNVCRIEEETTDTPVEIETRIIDPIYSIGQDTFIEVHIPKNDTPPAHGWILTYTGKKLYPLNPRMEDICIRDIAHGLSNICRFGGQCREFYSVAQHCVLVSYMSGPFGFHGQLHDASEGMGLLDIPTPVKKSPELAGYRAAENKLQAMIYRKFDLDETEPKEVKQVDSRMFITEALCLRDNHGLWQPKEEPYPFTITPLPPKEAEKLFLNRFTELMYERYGNDELLMKYLGE